MSDPAPALRRKPDLYFLVAGLASSLLYASILLSFAFLLPVQIAFGRRGGRQGMAAAGVSAVLIALVQASRLIAAGGLSAGAAQVLLAVGAGTLPPLVFLLALSLLNAPLWRRWDAVYGTLGVSALCVLIALPALIAVERSASIAAFLEETFNSVLSPLRSAVASSSDGYEASALAASLDAKDIISASFAILSHSFAAIIFAILGGSWWLGNRLSGLGSRGRAATLALDELRLPYPFLWAFLASWAFVLGAELSGAPVAVSAAGWNCALVVSLAYAGVGLGIISYLLKSRNAPKSLRALLAALAVVSLATPLGIAVAVSLPLIGVTETWIHYRKPKGVGI